MKINNWRKRIATTLVASGLISPAVAHAANLNTNLVTNGTFENVDLAHRWRVQRSFGLGVDGPQSVRILAQRQQFQCGRCARLRRWRRSARCRQLVFHTE